ncbi:type VI secretion system protein TssA [Oceanibaculum pacificum]|uniref:ImpA N-terminal domain-containing protein n=1 Tax=Oceanibaculum pacificum TaxID=580166 RepID=A0A154VMQ0_9PROT|nr:type VI secretion system protein TssA [Oceanibaculum pacificum]KZD02667.1 hypothetical protein AUP43_13590 [Oceanibaculum pacificum]
MTQPYPFCDLAALRKPISRKRPCGPSPRDSGVTDAIKPLRKAQDWAGIAQACQDALTASCKDLELAAWLTEAWLNRHGMAGLAAGLTVLADLAERFWGDIHPLPEAGDWGYRLAPLDWLERLEAAVLTLPLTQPAEPGVARYSFYDWQMAQHLAQLGIQDSKQHQKALREGAASLEDIHLSLQLTPDGWLHEAAGLFDGAAGALDRLTGIIDAEAPEAGFSGLPVLSRATALCADFLGQILLARPPLPEPLPETLSEPLAGIPALPPISPAIRTREDAYRHLAEAADYLLASEPHSPTPYLVRRAIGWGNMTLPALLAELMEGGEADLQRLRRLLGL